MKKSMLLLGALLFNVGCAQASYTKHLEALKNYTPIVRQVDETGKENEPFNKLYSGLEEYVKEIYFVYRSDIFDQFEEGHAHLCSKELKTTICIAKGSEELVTYHEAAHTRTRALQMLGSDFLERWKEISNFNHGAFYSGDLNWLTEPLGSWQGCLNSHARTTLNEDISTFLEPLGYKKTVEEIKELLFRSNEDLPSETKREIFKLPIDYPLYFCDPNDERYQQKIDLLQEYNYISEEQHKQIKEHCGVLFHLLEKFPNSMYSYKNHLSGLDSIKKYLSQSD